ncbi:hypothetical protein DFQ28_002487 [Apophysomyces sp. BC1034]|nr:hypothetical protein DFQ28_002487 [Apophysomyces sp. BC1034]
MREADNAALEALTLLDDARAAVALQLIAGLAAPRMRIERLAVELTERISNVVLQRDQVVSYWGQIAGRRRGSSGIRGCGCRPRIVRRDSGIE